MQRGEIVKDFIAEYSIFSEYCAKFLQEHNDSCCECPYQGDILPGEYNCFCKYLSETIE